jgi:hypothetical protein
MENLLLASTAVDVVAVAALAWLLWRGGHEREVALGEQRATLEALRTDLAQLVADAEGRTRELEEMLARREQRLRALVADVARAEAEVEERRPAPDPAEARLLRDLEMSFGRGRV